MIFNEEKLKQEITEKWGEHGVHAEVYDRVLKEIASLKKEKEELKDNFVSSQEVSQKWNDRYIRQREIKLEVVEENTKLKEQVKELNLMIKEAISLPKGVYPHSYSDYKNNNLKQG